MEERDPRLKALDISPHGAGVLQVEGVVRTLGSDSYRVTTRFPFGTRGVQSMLSIGISLN